MFNNSNLDRVNEEIKVNLLRNNSNTILTHNSNINSNISPKDMHNNNPINSNPTNSSNIHNSHTNKDISNNPFNNLIQTR